MTRRELEEAVIEYARNVDVVWHQPRQDTARGEAMRAVTLANGFLLLRSAINALDDSMLA